MTKFEEGFKALTSWDWVNVDLIQKILTKFGNWHSDEEFQQLLEQNAELTRENNVVNKIDSRLAKENEDLKSQLQQQALPVVPECVGKYIEECKKEGDCLFGIFADATRVEHDMPDFVYFWLGDEGNNDELFARAWLDGYQVEKPQLFYLKNKLTGAYLYYDEATKLYSDIVGNVEDFFGTKTKFTEAEIGSMHAESYEQIEVEK